MCVILQEDTIGDNKCILFLIFFYEHCRPARLVQSYDKVLSEILKHIGDESAYCFETCTLLLTLFKRQSTSSLLVIWQTCYDLQARQAQTYGQHKCRTRKDERIGASANRSKFIQGQELEHFVLLLLHAVCF